MSWLDELRLIHDEALSIDWDAHLRELNRLYNFTGDALLSTADDGLPPAWFNGDVETIRPHEWALVVSLNPAKPPAGYYQGDLTLETAWDFWRSHNTKWWYGRFFTPLVRVAAVSMGDPIPATTDGLKAFATNRMVFVEICPYASPKYCLDKRSLIELSESDIGFKYARRTLEVLVNEADPAVILVNGGDAVNEFEAVYDEKLEWSHKAYISIHSNLNGRPKTLWHYQGWFSTASGFVPIGGFNFLRKPTTHNSYQEIAELGRSLRELSESQHQTKPSPGSVSNS